MFEKGYGDNNWMIKYFFGENYSENVWNKRLDIFLLFFFKK